MDTVMETEMDSAMASVTVAKPSVLLVEDDHDAAEALSELLVEEGYEVTLAVDGQQALDKLAWGPAPDIILLDLMMPQVNGYEFRGRQLADPRLAAIPTIALTASVVDQRVRDLHLTGWVRKPVPIDALLSVIGKQRRAKGRPHDHLVHFYESEAKLTEKVCGFLADGLTRGEAAVAVATAAHGLGLRAALADKQLDVPWLEERGQLLILDARRTLARVMGDGHVRPELFAGFFTDTIDRLAAVAPSGRVRGSGEMVDVLWRGGDTKGALALEGCWNRLGESRRFMLLCAYLSCGADADPSAHDGVLRQHSALL